MRNVNKILLILTLIVVYLREIFHIPALISSRAFCSFSGKSLVLSSSPSCPSTTCTNSKLRFFFRFPKELGLSHLFPFILCHALQPTLMANLLIRFWNQCQDFIGIHSFLFCFFLLHILFKLGFASSSLSSEYLG